MKQSNQTFHDIFQGRKTAYGVNDNGKHYLIKSDVTPELMDKHLLGAISIGRIPIRENSTCKFGCMDLDDHKKGGVKKDFNYKKLIDKIKLLKLPLTVFKSKSGGAHCYLFLDKFYPARDVRHILKKLRYALGYNENVELFPKQDKVSSNDYGNFINLPYKGGNSRVLINSEGKELNFDEGMEYAAKRVFKLEQMKPYKILADKEFTDSRNERLFRAKQFFKKINPDDYENKVLELNKLYDNPLEEKEVNATVLKEGAKDYWENPEQEEIPSELNAYDVMEYRQLPIPKPEWILQGLIKEKTINIISAQKGTGKTEKAIGLMWAISKGLPFLHYNPVDNDGISYAYPCAWIDGEMDPYDSIDRTTPYIETFGPPPKNYFQIINFALQKYQNIPDIKDEPGQKLILQHLKKQELQTGKKPLVCFDNLRSLSNYKENDSDGFRPIGLFLRNLRGLGYTVLVIDHSGKDASAGVRGTSSKTDWANVVLLLKAEGPKGQKFMKMRVSFDKARGLKPEQTADYVCQYDFKGNWTLATSDKELEEKVFIDRIKNVLKDFPDMSQEKIGKIVGCSTGKVNKLIQKIRSN
jgi:hypothetical protein